MNALVLVSLVAIVVAQQPEELRVPPAVLIAGAGFFGQGKEGNLDTNVDAVLVLKSNKETTTDSQTDGLPSNVEIQQGKTIGTAIEGVFEPLNLPAGATLILGPIDTSFVCGEYPYGYYSDEGNYCRIFHVCVPYLFEDGHIEPIQYSFMCGESTVFDQKELTCVDQSAAIPCEEAHNFYSRNEEFGLPEEKL